MTCERTRWRLSLDPQVTEPSLDPLTRRHLVQCPACRAFRLALLRVESDLQAQPLARPAADLLPAVMRGVEQSPQHAEIEPPFSRAFCLVCAAVTLFALVAGAYLLQNGPIGSLWRMDPGFARTWVSPGWPRDASAWLTQQGTQAAQVVLATMAGILLTAAGTVIGFRASARGH